jgi:hypothetical protein
MPNYTCTQHAGSRNFAKSIDNKGIQRSVNSSGRYFGRHADGSAESTLIARRHHSMGRGSLPGGARGGFALCALFQRRKFYPQLYADPLGAVNGTWRQLLAARDASGPKLEMLGRQRPPPTDWISKVAVRVPEKLKVPRREPGETSIRNM